MSILHYASLGQRVIRCRNVYHVTYSIIKRYTSTIGSQSNAQSQTYRTSEFEGYGQHHDFSELVQKSTTGALTPPALFSSWADDFWFRYNLTQLTLPKILHRPRVQFLQAAEVSSKAISPGPEAALDSQDVFGDLASAADDDHRDLNTVNPHKTSRNSIDRFEVYVSDSSESGLVQNADKPVPNSLTSKEKQLEAPSFEEWFQNWGANDYLLTVSQRSSYQMRLCKDHERLAKIVQRLEKQSTGDFESVDDHIKDLLFQHDAYGTTMLRSELSQLKHRLDFLLTHFDSLMALSTWELRSFMLSHHDIERRRLRMPTHDRIILTQFQDYQAILRNHVIRISDIHDFYNGGIRCQDTIGYKFKDLDLLSRAFGISEAVPGRSLTTDQRRLALLGDGMLRSFLVKRWFPTKSRFSKCTSQKHEQILIRAGDFETIFHQIGTNKALAVTYRQHGLHKCHPGTIESTTADATTLEAILGAVYADGGDDALEKVMRNLGMVDVFEKEIERLEILAAEDQEATTQSFSTDTGGYHHKQGNGSTFELDSDLADTEKDSREPEDQADPGSPSSAQESRSSDLRESAIQEDNITKLASLSVTRPEMLGPDRTIALLQEDLGRCRKERAKVIKGEPHGRKKELLLRDIGKQIISTKDKIRRLKRLLPRL